MIEHFRDVPGEIGELLTQREKLGKWNSSPPEAITKVFAEMWKKNALPFICQLNAVKNFQELLQEPIAKNYSRPFLCASVIYSASFEMLTGELSRELAKTSPQAFILNFDTTTGLLLTTVLLAVAEEELRGEADELISKTISQIGLQDEEAHLAFITDKNIIKASSMLLIKDPTGFLLVDEVARGLKEEKDSPLKDLSSVFLKNPTAKIKNFVIAGAELGAELYKKLYALCPEPKIPPKPPV